jgi:putative transposase
MITSRLWAMSRYHQFLTSRRSRRHRDHDYSEPGRYFVTICTKDRRTYFGEIRDGIMGLNDLGWIAHACLEALPAHIDDIEMGAFIVMPNHVHALIGLMPEDDGVAPLHATAQLDTKARRYRRGPGITPPSPPAAGSLGTVVRSYKSAVTRLIRRAGFEFAWQPRFHDHVVRNERALHRVHDYIVDNPARWRDDRFHP